MRQSVNKNRLTELGCGEQEVIDENVPTTNRFQAALPWLVLAIGLMLTFFGWRYVLNDEIVQADELFAAEVKEHVRAIQHRMETYEQTLFGGVALFVASNEVSREEWRIYVEMLRVKEKFPGIQGYGWSVIIKPGEMDQHIKAMRRDLPWYSPRPPGPRDLYTSVIYLEPLDERNKNAIGYDMWSQETRREAMARARDSGKPILSGKVTLVQEIKDKAQTGTLMYLPVYRKGIPIDTVEQRREAIIGFVYAPFRMDDLMAGILGSREPSVDLHIYDGDSVSEKDLMHDSDGVLIHESTGEMSFHLAERLEIAGRQWTLDFHATPAFQKKVDMAKPSWIAIGGTMVSLLLFALVWNLSRSQKRAEILARRMTIELSTSEARITTVLSTAINGIITMGPDRRIQTFNLGAEAMFGYRAEEVIGRNVNILMPSPYTDEHDGYVTRHLETGIQRIIGLGREVTGLRKNGQIFPAWLTVGRADVKGGPLFVGCLVDITERKRAEDEIRKLFLAVEQSPSAVIITDPKGNITYVNPRFTEVTGYTSEEVLGRNPRLLKSGHTNTLEYQDMWHTILSGEVWRGELLNRKKEGSTYWAAVAISAIRDQQREISGFVAVQEDVTLRKDAENALVKAKETAEEANRAKSDFLNTMSHELRTPLTVILGYLPLMSQPHLKLPPARKLVNALETETQKELFNSLMAMIGKMTGEMQRNGDHLLTLINDLLDISKIEAGKLTLNPALLHVQPLVDGVMDALRNKAEGKGLRLVNGGTNLTVWADDVRFKQILLNLVGNAVKFTDRGEVHVEAVIQGEMAEFAVIDTGSGIPPDELERVFERFHQVDNSTTRKAGGTGLGLAITRNLVLLSGGEIRVESRLGEGSVFRFTMPVRDMKG